MGDSGHISLRLLAALLTLVFASSCAVRVKVREDWNLAKDELINLPQATATWERIQRGEILDTEELFEYNKAVRSSVVQVTENWMERESQLSLIDTTEGQFGLSVTSVNVSDVDSLDEVVPADFVRVRRGFDESTVVDGVGTSLLVRQVQSPEDPMVPESGLWYPVTAVLNLDVPTSPVLQLYDPTRDGEFGGGRRRFPLAANYTAAFARDFQDRQFQFMDLQALFRFEKYAKRMGLYRVSAFDPSKKVCILTHGIYSSPTTWDQALNEFYAHDDLRENYEFWTFGYPTGAPIPYLAAKYRKSIREMLAFRQKNGATDSGMVLVGHSMGGLLSKAVTQHGGDEQWNRLFKVPIEELRVSGEQKEILREMVYYEPIPEIETVVFCSTPHRGSKIAANPGARLVGNLIQVPVQLAKLSKDIVSQSQYALTPLGLELAKNRTTSLEQLSSNSRLPAEYLFQPLNPAVEFHSIIGCNKKEGTPLAGTSDNIVGYESARIEGVETEAVVYEVGHGLHRTSEGIEEIVRVLKNALP